MSSSSPNGHVFHFQTARLVSFDERPSWKVLALTIAQQFSISPNRVSVIFWTNSDGDITVEKERDLQSFYVVYNPSSGKIKGIVQDLQAPDRESASNWLSLLSTYHSPLLN
jgi:hypothetical protein